MFKTRKRLLPINSEKLFLINSSDRNSRKESDFRSKTVRTAIKLLYFSAWSKVMEQCGQEVQKLSTSRLLNQLS